jgi:hypothetical protein
MWHRACRLELPLSFWKDMLQGGIRVSRKAAAQGTPGYVPRDNELQANWATLEQLQQR